jgi:drug/metabolite transporter (DMT)-like permease
MGVAFGGAFPAIKAGLADAPPLLFAALRYDLAALLLLAYAAFVLGNWRPRLRADWLAVLAGGVLFIGSSGFLYLGQQYTTAGVSAIIYSLGPILTVVFAWVLLPAERLSRRALIGVLIGLVGVALVVRPTPAVQRRLPGQAAGVDGHLGRHARVDRDSQEWVTYARSDNNGPLAGAGRRSAPRWEPPVR